VLGGAGAANLSPASGSLFCGKYGDVLALKATQRDIALTFSSTITALLSQGISPLEQRLRANKEAEKDLLRENSNMEQGIPQDDECFDALMREPIGRCLPLACRFRNDRSMPLSQLGSASEYPSRSHSSRRDLSTKASNIGRSPSVSYAGHAGSDGATPCLVPIADIQLLRP
jgi:hypothetical protein